MKNNKGQTVTEMVIVLPLLVMMAGGMLFMVYAGWQDLKLQQAANLIARVEGQEKVSGGLSPAAIDQENGFGPGSGYQDADGSVGHQNFETPGSERVSSGSSPYLIVRMKNLLKGFFQGGGVTLSQPLSGQNVDQITITKILPTFKIPFMKGNSNTSNQITLKGTAYGGEDPYMYALPRWGSTDGTYNPEWRKILKTAHQSAE